MLRRFFIFVVLSGIMPFLANAGQLSDEEKEEILMMHNEARSKVNPPASNMLKMSWDNKMEYLANEWASKCKYKHPDKTNSKFKETGQNLALLQGTSAHHVRLLIHGFLNEISFYNFRENICATGRKCGHYTQMIWSSTDKVGCALKHCPAGTIKANAATVLLVCQYSPAGNVNGGKPYYAGESCSQCPPHKSKCNENLCSGTTTGKCSMWILTASLIIVSTFIRI